MKRILTLFNKTDNIIVAFSGGNDSFILAYILKKFSYNFKIVYVNTPFHSTRFLNFALKKANILNLKLEIINIENLPKKVLENSRERCYYCKKNLFIKIKENYPQFKIIDGTNYSDTFEYRPGLKALEELTIISPFKILKITKEDILNYYKKEKLDKIISPSTTCLATRVKYGIEITDKILKKIDKAESILHENGIEFSRLRVFDKEIFFLELMENEIGLINRNLIEKIKNFLNISKLEIRAYKKGVFDK